MPPIVPFDFCVGCSCGFGTPPNGARKAMKMSPLELRILEVVNGYAGRTPYVDAMMRALTVFGVVPPMLVVIVGVWGARDAWRRRGFALTMLGASLAVPAALRLEAMLYRPRPFISRPVHLLVCYPTNDAFPSVQATVTAALVVGLIVYGRRERWLWLPYLILAGSARIFSGIENPYDVLTAWLIGASIGLIVTCGGLIGRSSVIQRTAEQSPGIRIVFAAISVVAFGAAFAWYERPFDELSVKACNHSFAKKRVIALTFDDGPHPETTPLLLDILRKNHVRATFFVVGTQVKAHQSLLRRIHDDGHQAACHTYSHHDLTKMSDQQVSAELTRWCAVTRPIIGGACGCMRPPGGNYNRATISVLRRTRYDLALWNVNPGDWRGIPPSEITRFVVSHAHPGDVVLLHDGGMNTVRALPVIIRELKKRGYGFVTMREIACGPTDRYRRAARSSLCAPGPGSRRVGEREFLDRPGLGGPNDVIAGEPAAGESLVQHLCAFHHVELQVEAGIREEQVQQQRRNLRASAMLHREYARARTAGLSRRNRQ